MESTSVSCGFFLGKLSESLKHVLTGLCTVSTYKKGPSHLPKQQ